MIKKLFVLSLISLIASASSAFAADQRSATLTLTGAIVQSLQIDIDSLASKTYQVDMEHAETVSAGNIGIYSNSPSGWTVSFTSLNGGNLVGIDSSNTNESLVYQLSVDGGNFVQPMTAAAAAALPANPQMVSAGGFENSFGSGPSPKKPLLVKHDAEVGMLAGNYSDVVTMTIAAK